jgi:hypothetical protein
MVKNIERCGKKRMEMVKAAFESSREMEIVGDL